jgi:hypothetical protein
LIGNLAFVLFDTRSGLEPVERIVTDIATSLDVRQVVPCGRHTTSTLVDARGLCVIPYLTLAQRWMIKRHLWI